MFFTSVAPFWFETFLKSVADSLLTLPGASLFTAAEVMLWTNDDLLPDRTTTFADLTEATFVGYARQTPAAWAGPLNLSANSTGLMASVLFEGGAIVAPGETCYGYALLDGTPEIILVEKFTTPIDFVNSGDFLQLDVIAALRYLGQVA